MRLSKNARSSTRSAYLPSRYGVPHERTRTSVESHAKLPRLDWNSPERRLARLVCKEFLENPNGLAVFIDGASISATCGFSSDLIREHSLSSRTFIRNVTRCVCESMYAVRLSWAGTHLTARIQGQSGRSMGR